MAEGRAVDEAAGQVARSRSGATVGYARVSSTGQSLDVQRGKLKGCDKLFEETRSGTTTHARPELKACLTYLREGDTLVVTRLDRLARSTLHLCQIAEVLEEKGVALRVLDQSIDTSDATGRLLFNMLGAIGQFETELRAERQMDGIAKARERGVRFGRKKRLSAREVDRLRADRAQGTLIRELMARHGLSKASVYRYLAGEGESVVEDALSVESPRDGPSAVNRQSENPRSRTRR